LKLNVTVQIHHTLSLFQKTHLQAFSFKLGEPVVQAELLLMRLNQEDLAVTLQVKWKSLQDKLSSLLSDAVANMALQSEVMEDSQEEDMVQKETLLEVEVVDSFVFSLLTQLKEVKSYFVLDLVVAAATKKEDSAVVKSVVKLMETAECQELKLLVDQELQVSMVPNLKEETVTLVDSKILDLMTDLEEELDTSVEKEVATMLEEVAVAQATVTLPT